MRKASFTLSLAMEQREWIKTHATQHGISEGAVVRILIEMLSKQLKDQGTKVEATKAEFSERCRLANVS